MGFKANLYTCTQCRRLRTCFRVHKPSNSRNLLIVIIVLVTQIFIKITQHESKGKMKYLSMSNQHPEVNRRHSSQNKKKNILFKV